MSNGTRIRGTPIVVDYWRTKSLPPRMLFFLTHMHAGNIFFHASWNELLLAGMSSFHVGWNEIEVTSLVYRYVCMFVSADHTSGLSSSWPYPIHCTSLTGQLMIEKFNINPKLVVSFLFHLLSLLALPLPSPFSEHQH